MINLGVSVKDTVSGFEGVVLTRQESLFEATQCFVQPKQMKEGAISPGAWISEGRLKVISEDDKPLAGFLNIAGACR